MLLKGCLRGVFGVALVALSACSSWSLYQADLKDTSLASMSVSADHTSQLIERSTEEQLASLGATVNDAGAQGDATAALKLHGYNRQILRVGSVSTDAEITMYRIQLTAAADLTVGKDVQHYKMVAEDSMTVSSNDTIVANPQVDQLTTRLQQVIIGQLIDQMLVDYGHLHEDDKAGS